MSSRYQNKFFHSKVQLQFECQVLYTDTDAKEKFLKPHVKLQSQKICLSNIFQLKSLSTSVFSINACKDFVVYV